MRKMSEIINTLIKRGYYLSLVTEYGTFEFYRQVNDVKTVIDLSVNSENFALSRFFVNEEGKNVRPIQSMVSKFDDLDFENGIAARNCKTWESILL